MLDTPQFNFDWKKMYLEWQTICVEERVDQNVLRVLEYDIDSRAGDLDIDSDYEWLPISSDLSQIGPQKTSAKGHPLFASHMAKASQITISVLMDNFGDNEATACAWIMACALQLQVDLPPYWRGTHNQRFLSGLYRFCRDVMSDRLKWRWNRSSNQIFPQKFFSKTLLETTDFLTVPQIVRFAALNARYYLDKYFILKYTIDGLSVGEYHAKRAHLLFGQWTDLPHEAPTKNKGRAMEDDGRCVAPQIGKPKLFISESRSGDLREGRRKQGFSNTVERNSTARRICLEHYGPTCIVCGLNFEKAFGRDFAGIIDVHHIDPISQKMEDHLVDPIEDLVPLCPNCHRMIHRKGDGVYSPDELRSLIGNDLQSDGNRDIGR